MKCPNCNGEIGRFDISAECKHCGVNIFYSQQEKLLAQDAKKCELEFASFHIFAAKFKAALIGGKLQIARIVAMVVAIGIIFIPFVTLNVELPLISAKFSLGAFGLYQAFSGGELTAMLLDLSPYIPQVTTAVTLLCALFVLIFLMGLLVFVGLLLSFINIQKVAKKMCAVSVFGFIFSVMAAAMSIALPDIVQGSFVSAKTGVGTFFCAAIFAVIFVLNKLVIKKGIMPDIKQVDLMRVEMRKKIKSGAITLDDLPLPVFESEEEREKRLEQEAESKNLADKARGGERNG